MILLMLFDKFIIVTERITKHFLVSRTLFLQNIAIFCDSEFFHGEDWEVLRPRIEKVNNPEYWKKKILRNMERDDEVNKQLFPSDAALEKMLYLASKNVIKKWTQRYRNWDQVLNQLIVLYGEQLTNYL